MGRRSDRLAGSTSVESSYARNRTVAPGAQSPLAEATFPSAANPMAKILLAAGGGSALEAFRDAIAGENATVLLASDGDEALARWWAEDPDLLVVDAALPNIDGFEICRAIRGASETPVVIVATSSGDELVVRGLDCGADDVVTAPLRTAVFRLRLRAVINRYRAAKRDRIASARPLGRGRLDPDGWYPDD